MAPKGIGSEDFVMLEWKGKRNQTTHHQTTHIQYVQHQMSAPKRETINSHEAVKKYGGVLLVDHRKNVNPPREAIDCFEAVKMYGGVLLVDNSYKTQGKPTISCRSQKPTPSTL